MVELRWRNVYSKVKHNGSNVLLKTVLEYRQQLDTQWTTWMIVPTIDEE